MFSHGYPTTPLDVRSAHAMETPKILTSLGWGEGWKHSTFASLTTAQKPSESMPYGCEVTGSSPQAIGVPYGCPHHHFLLPSASCEHVLWSPGNPKRLPFAKVSGRKPFEVAWQPQAIPLNIWQKQSEGRAARLLSNSKRLPLPAAR